MKLLVATKNTMPPPGPTSPTTHLPPIEHNNPTVVVVAAVVVVVVAAVVVVTRAGIVVVVTAFHTSFLPTFVQTKGDCFVLESAPTLEHFCPALDADTSENDKPKNNNVVRLTVNKRFAFTASP